MSKLKQVLNDLESVYLESLNSIERFNILHEIEVKMKELRKFTMENIVDHEYNNLEHNIHKLRVIFSGQVSISVESITPFVQIDSTIESIYDQFGLDSLDFVELIMLIEQEFNVEIDDETAEAFDTINDILQVVTK